VLSLDATVVLLTPVVFAAAAHAGARPRPHVFACTHLANSASLLLPVSNLTNLLVFARSGLSFPRFAALMTLPWLAAIAVEYVGIRRYFRTDLTVAAVVAEPSAPMRVPGFSVVVLVLTLAGFVVCSAVNVNPAWSAFAGVLVLAVRAVGRRRVRARDALLAANPAFCAFVLALGVIVQGVVANGLGDALTHLLPDGSSLPELLLIVLVAAVLANLINNLPAVLALLPVAASGGVGALLAVLIGVNLGPNLTYVGSLATLLWRRIVHEHDDDPGLGRFTALGLRTVPATLVAATVALWVGLQVIGG
jgi:arsenical pump membrane protein